MNWFSKKRNSTIIIMGVEFEPSQQDFNYILQEAGLISADIMTINVQNEWIQEDKDVKKIGNDILKNADPDFKPTKASILRQNISGRQYVIMCVNG